MYVAYNFNPLFFVSKTLHSMQLAYTLNNNIVSEKKKYYMLLKSVITQNRFNFTVPLCCGIPFN